MSMITAICPLCGGVQGVESKSDPAEVGDESAPSTNARKRPWWRFWA